MQMPGGGTYWCAMVQGKPVAGIFSIDAPEFDGVPESWMSYLAVDDVDKRVARGGQGRRQIDEADLRCTGCRPHRHSDGAGWRGCRLDDAGRQLKGPRDQLVSEAGVGGD